MEVILKEDVTKLGSRGDVVKVAEGYGRNFLLPHKLAIEATAGNKAVIVQMKAASVRRSAKEKTQAEELAKQFDGLSVSFQRRSGEHDHLFGSVTSGDLAALGHKLAEQPVILVVDVRDFLGAELADFFAPEKFTSAFARRTAGAGTSPATSATESWTVSSRTLSERPRGPIAGWRWCFCLFSHSAPSSLLPISSIADLIADC